MRYCFNSNAWVPDATPEERDRIEEQRKAAEADRAWAEEHVKTLTYGQCQALKAALR